MSENASDALLTASGLCRYYGLSRPPLGEPRPVLRPLDGVDLELVEGGSLGIVGESGSGKSRSLRSTRA